MLTWWLQRGGCTRSHSELGRETPLRQWYFVSRRGRVGRCQVCQTQRSHQQIQLLKTKQNITISRRLTQSGRPFAFANNVSWPLQIPKRKSILTTRKSAKRRKARSGKSRTGDEGWSSIPSEAEKHSSLLRPDKRRNPGCISGNRRIWWRGVEQPGSSSGS